MTGLAELVALLWSIVETGLLGCCSKLDKSRVPDPSGSKSFYDGIRYMTHVKESFSFFSDFRKK